ncbi:MAG TPA: hypothetical protein VE422_20065 [Terriglobia bacterium]|nr:hypothetical protein [Terriglobia bacterium]
METLRIKLEIADRKFEAEGPVEIVQEQANAFMKLIMGGSAETLAAEAARAAQEPMLDKIMRAGGRIVWLTVPSRSPAEALLVLLLGQRRIRNNDLVSGIDLIRGLRSSGHRLARADYLLNSHARKELIAVHGKHRARRYELTESGALRAQEIARQLLASLPTPGPLPETDQKPLHD